MTSPSHRESEPGTLTIDRTDLDTGLRRGPVRFPDGSPPLPHGCRWCGQPVYRHGARDWIASAGTHAWTRPTPAQTIARMRARRKVRAEARRMARVLVAFERGADLVGPAERRRRVRQARELTAVPAPDAAAVPAGRRRVCDEMNHDGRGHEVFCQEDPDDRHPVHDDGHGTTWNRED